MRRGSLRFWLRYEFKCFNNCFSLQRLMDFRLYIYIFYDSQKYQSKDIVYLYAYKLFQWSLKAKQQTKHNKKAKSTNPNLTPLGNAFSFLSSLAFSLKCSLLTMTAFSICSVHQPQVVGKVLLMFSLMISFFYWSQPASWLTQQLFSPYFSVTTLLLYWFQDVAFIILFLTWLLK